MTTIIVSGWRDATLETHKSVIWPVLSYHFQNSKAPPAEWLLVHGNARGVDAIADLWAQHYTIEKQSYPYMSHLGRAGGPARNRIMVDEHLWQNPIICAFPHPELSKGTYDLIGYAESKGLIIHVTELE
jgi:hypothetical protein